MKPVNMHVYNTYLDTPEILADSIVVWGMQAKMFWALAAPLGRLIGTDLREEWESEGLYGTRESESV